MKLKIKCHISKALLEPIQPEYLHVAQCTANTQSRCARKVLTTSQFEANGTNLQMHMHVLQLSFPLTSFYTFLLPM
jgi:hypothetical protein